MVGALRYELCDVGMLYLALTLQMQARFWGYPAVVNQFVCSFARVLRLTPCNVAQAHRQATCR